MNNRWYIDYKKPAQANRTIKKRKAKNHYLTKDDVGFLIFMFFSVGVWVGMIVMREFFLKAMW